MKIVLQNGVELTGNQEDVIRTAMKLGYVIDETKYHYSENQGKFILISEMAENYIANCIRNMTAGCSAYSAKDLADFLTRPHYLALLNEYAKRKEVKK